MNEQKDTLYYKLANFYWLYSSKKDYLAETLFIDSILKRYFHSAKKILDVGCGQGDHINELAKKGYGVTGVDKSEKQIEKGKKRFPNLKLNSGDFLEYKDSGKYDCLTMLWNTILYFTPPKRLIIVFKKVNNLLTEGGLFVFDFRSFSDHIRNNSFKSNLRREIKEEDHRFVLETKNVLDLNRRVLIEKTKSTVYGPQNKILFETDHKDINLNILSLEAVKILLKTSGFNILEVFDMDALYKNNLHGHFTKNSNGYTIVSQKVSKEN